MKSFLASLLAALTLFASQSAAALDVKGVKPGMTREQVRDTLGNLDCTREAESGDCISWRRTIAGKEAESFRVSFSGEACSGVTVLFSADTFELVRTGLIEKFGRPTSTSTGRVQNRAGAVLPNSSATWKAGGAELTVTERYIDANTASLILTSPSALRDAQQREKARAKAAAADL